MTRTTIASVAKLMKARSHRNPPAKLEALEALTAECPAKRTDEEHKFLRYVHIRVPGRGKHGKVECINGVHLETTLHYWRLEANRRLARNTKKYPNRKNISLFHVAKSAKQEAWESARRH